MLVRKLVSAIALAAMLGACAGRDAAPPMPVSMGNEDNLSCKAIYAEMNVNNARIYSLHQEEDNKRGQNIAMGVVGALIFWPALFAMDFKDGAGKDRANVEARNAFLQSMYAQKSCASGV
jgi:hypothetical protein